MRTAAYIVIAITLVVMTGCERSAYWKHSALSVKAISADETKVLIHVQPTEGDDQKLSILAPRSYIANVLTEEVTELDLTGIGRMNLSPDFSKMVCETGRWNKQTERNIIKIVIRDLKTKSEATILEGTFPVLAAPDYYSMFSPDGTKVAVFEFEKMDDDSAQYGETAYLKIYSYSLADGKLSKMAQFQYNQFDIEWFKEEPQTYPARRWVRYPFVNSFGWFPDGSKVYLSEVVGVGIGGESITGNIKTVDMTTGEMDTLGIPNAAIAGFIDADNVIVVKPAQFGPLKHTVEAAHYNIPRGWTQVLVSEPNSVSLRPPKQIHEEFTTSDFTYFPRNDYLGRDGRFCYSLHGTVHCVAFSEVGWSRPSEVHIKGYSENPIYLKTLDKFILIRDQKQVIRTDLDGRNIHVLFDVSEIDF